MSAKVLIIVACLVVGLLVQSNHAFISTAIVIAQYTPKFAALTIKIGATTARETIEIAKGREIIEKTVNVAQDSVNDQVKDLNALVKQAKEDAKKNGTNINDCVKTEQNQLRKINLYALNNCRTPLSVNLLGLKLAEIGKQEGVLAVNVNLCIIKHPIFASKLKECFDKELQKIEDKLVSIHNDIAETLTNAQNESHDCIEQRLGALDWSIYDVSFNFKRCVKLVMSQKQLSKNISYYSS